VHRSTYLDEQLDAFADEQRTGVAIRVDRLPVDELHDQIRRGVVELPAVDQTGDRGMIERRQDVPFAVQPAAQARVQNGMLQHLDRDGLLVLRIIAFAAVDRAHAAMAENRYDAIRADPRADETIAVILEQRFCGGTDCIEQRIFALTVALEQRLDRSAQLGIVGALRRKLRRTVGLRHIRKLIEQRLNSLPACVLDHREKWPSPSISSSNQARASRMSRCTVAVDVLTAAATSS
jgi:hypothetical protein